ncbi:MAG: hypothetical protein JNL57_13605 [Bacteroidetes bacterium]|nr:hypothetical protein [Bacteroidota bacterium]
MNKLINYKLIHPIDINYLINNINTGIEFEYSLFYHLLPKELKVLFQSQVIDKHIYSERIKSIINSTSPDLITELLNNHNIKPEDILLSTQDDSIGPADIVIRSSDINILGLSVKYQNNCTLNVSSKYFLTANNMAWLGNQLPFYANRYVKEMTSEYGNPDNWFRKRKTSKETDSFIDLIRTKVIEDWSVKSVDQKQTLLNKLIHANSPIDFWVIKFSGNGNSYNYTVNTTPPKFLDPDVITLKKVATSFIGFFSNGILIAKMQVKFNNGILEKNTKANPDLVVDKVHMKYGDPFGSWNFSIE